MSAQRAVSVDTPGGQNRSAGTFPAKTMITPLDGSLHLSYRRPSRGLVVDGGKAPLCESLPSDDGAAFTRDVIQRRKNIRAEAIP